MSLQDKIFDSRICNGAVAKIFVEDIKKHIKELQDKLLNPNTKSKNFIEISDFKYHLIESFGNKLCEVEDVE